MGGSNQQFGPSLLHLALTTFTGKQFDPLISLYDLRARYYNPADGRFLSRDTAAFDPNNPTELNRYAYAVNNPINARDPSGHDIGFTGYSLSIRVVSLPGSAEVVHVAFYVAAAIVFDVIAFAVWRQTSTGEVVKVRPLSPSEVKKRGLHGEKQEQRYGATDEIYEETQPEKGRTWIGNKDEKGELQPFP